MLLFARDNAPARRKPGSRVTIFKGRVLFCFRLGGLAPGLADISSLGSHEPVVISHDSTSNANTKTRLLKNCVFVAKQVHVGKNDLHENTEEGAWRRGHDMIYFTLFLTGN